MSRAYEFKIPTPAGLATISATAESMMVCPCGHEFFRLVARVAYFKPPRSIIVKQNAEAEPLCLAVNVYICDKCGREIGPDDQTKREAQEAAQGSRSPLAKFAESLP